MQYMAVINIIDVTLSSTGGLDDPFPVSSLWCITDYPYTCLMGSAYFFYCFCNVVEQRWIKYETNTYKYIMPSSFLHLGQISIHVNFSQLVGLFFDLLFVFELVRLHLVVELGDEGTETSDGEQSGIRRVVDADCGGRYTSLVNY